MDTLSLYDDASPAPSEPFAALAPETCITDPQEPLSEPDPFLTHVPDDLSDYPVAGHLTACEAVLGLLSRADVAAQASDPEYGALALEHLTETNAAIEGVIVGRFGGMTVPVGYRLRETCQYGLLVMTMMRMQLLAEVEGCKKLLGLPHACTMDDAWLDKLHADIRTADIGAVS